MGDDSEAIKNEIISSFDSLPVEDLKVDVADSVVSLAGLAIDSPTKEKAILIAGNVKDIAQVNSDELLVKDLPVETEEVEPVFYTIKKGDTFMENSF